MRKTNKWGKAVLQLLCIACLSLALVACGGGNSSQTPPATATPTLTVSQRVLGMNLGDEATLHAALKDSDEQLVWSSSDADVVSVDGQGKLTAKKAGTATVTVTAGELTDSCVVTVTVGVIPDLDAGGNVEMLAGKTYRMAPVVTYNGNPVADAPEFTFASADDAIATVGEDGTITGVAMGETEISVFAEYRYSKLYASAIVTVKEDIVLTLNESVLQLHTLAYGSAVSQGEILPTLKVNGNVQDGSAIRWSVSGDAVTVQNGTVNAVKAGTATVTASYTAESGVTVSADCAVNVKLTEIDTNINCEYEIRNVNSPTLFTLSAISGNDDFVAANVEGISCDGKEIFASKDGNGIVLDANNMHASAEAQMWTVRTQKAAYSMRVTVYSMKVQNSADLYAVQNSLIRTQGTSVDTDRYTYSGYVVITQDITYETTVGDFTGIATTVSNNTLTVHEFNGIIDGQNHTISGLKLKNIGNACFVGGLGKDSVIKNLNFQNVSVVNGGQGIVNSMRGGVLLNVDVKGSIKAGGANMYWTTGLLVSKFHNSVYTAPKLAAKDCDVTVIEDTTPSDKFSAAYGFAYNRQNNILFENCRLYGSEKDLAYWTNSKPEDINDFIFMKGSKAGLTVTLPREAIPVNYEMLDPTQDGALQLPDINEADFVAANVTSIMHNDDQLFKAVGDNGKVLIDNAKVAPERVMNCSNYTAEFAPQNWILTTKSGAAYNMTVSVYSIIVSDEDDLRNIEKSLLKKEVIVGAQTKYAFDGYVIFDADVTMPVNEGKFGGIATYTASGNAHGINVGFVGVIDGKGHSVSGLQPNGTNSAFIGGMGQNGVLKNLNFIDTVVTGTYKAGVVYCLSGGTIDTVTISGTIENKAQNVGSRISMLFCSAQSYTKVNNVNVIITEDKTLNKDTTRKYYTAFGYFSDEKTATGFKPVNCRVYGGGSNLVAYGSGDAFTLLAEKEGITYLAEIPA